MGYHPHAYLVVGVKADKILKPVVETQTCTKYDVDTGEPYEQENYERTVR